ncbi:50S ribosomal protein L25 [bacterium]|nr:50S ribosomal protein L25 [bacterium]
MNSKRHLKVSFWITKQFYHMAKSPHITAIDRGPSSAATRASGGVPAVLYGHGIENQTLAVDKRAFDKLFTAAGHTTLVTLTVDKKDHNVLIREIQRHAVHDWVLHADFYQVRMDEKVTADVPLVFSGESPAVKDLGGVLVRTADKVSVEALPADLPRDVIVDITALTDFETVIKISDLPIAKGVQVLRDADDAVASVQPPRTEAELEELSEEVTEDVEGVEGVVSEEDGDGEGEGEEGATDEATGEAKAGEAPAESDTE